MEQQNQPGSRDEINRRKDQKDQKGGQQSTEAREDEE